MVTYKAIPGCEGYRAGDDGSIWSRRGRWGLGEWHRLKPSINKRNRYPYVAVHVNGKQTTRAVHSLVLLAFRGPCPAGQESRHKNNDRADPRLENLEYGTPVQNAADKFRHGTQRAGEAIHFARATVAVVLEIRKRCAEGETLSAVARDKKMTVGNVHAIVHRRTWKHV